MKPSDNNKDVLNTSALALAFLGDAVHSLYIREMLVRKGVSKPGELNSEALEYVTAARQAEAMRKIEPYLTEAEADTYRRARNNSHLRHPKSACASDYYCATGFEAVLGMLYLSGDLGRIEALLSIAIGKNPDDAASVGQEI